MIAQLYTAGIYPDVLQIITSIHSYIVVFDTGRMQFGMTMKSLLTQTCMSLMSFYINLNTNLKVDPSNNFPQHIIP